MNKKTLLKNLEKIIPEEVYFSEMSFTEKKGGDLILAEVFEDDFSHKKLRHIKEE